ncbi:TonB-dependent receptor [Sinimarinibacterium flocculans]|uniref:TonB-dependent receptor n=1 Tax=Sinimarinibacterium flocculans TaxID=985250 RepID=UPI0035197CE9
MDTPIRIRVSCALFAAALPALAHGQSPPPEEPVELEEIIVRSGPFGRTADELVQPVDVLSGEALERRRRGTVGDVLADRPGIANASFGPGVGRPVIRGQGGPRVLLLENSIASMDASSISADHAVTVDPLDADQIEVIKGPATLIYGGAASAGIVNVIDDRLPDIVVPGLRLRGNLSYGDNGDERNGALRARYGVGEFQLGVNVARREAGEFDIPGYATRAGADAHEGHDHAEEEEEERYGVLDNSDLRTDSYGASAAWVRDRGMLGVAVTRFESNYGIPGHGHAHEEDAGEEEEAHSHDGVRIDMEQTRTDLRGLLYDPLPGFDRLELRAGINDYRHREIEPGGEVGTTFDVQETETRIELAHRPIGEWVGVAGLHVSHRDFEAVGEEAFVPPVVTRGLGLFLVESRKIAGHEFEIGARVDQVEHEPQSDALADTDFTPLSLSTGINFLFGDHLHLRVNLQRAQRAPAAEELYAFGPHLATLAFERGDAALDVETANNLDLSFGRDRGRWTWEVGAFYNRINDYVFLREVDEGLNADGSGTPSSDGVADRVDESGTFEADGELLLVDVTQQDAEFYGAEIWLRHQLIDEGPLRLALRGFGDTVRGRLKSDGQNLPRISPSRLGISADAEFGDWSAALGYTRVFEHDRLAPLETNTPGHDLVSADLEYALPFQNVRTTIYLQGRNLLDEKQRLSTSFLKDVAPQPGRSLFVGLRFDFLSPI